jgi:hypothetical protein
MTMSLEDVRELSDIDPAHALASLRRERLLADGCEALKGTRWVCPQPDIPNQCSAKAELTTGSTDDAWGFHSSVAVRRLNECS